MKNQDKATTALVRSMKRNLEQHHGIKVPHAALRASYLQALGENPHAFAGRTPEAELPATLAPVADTSGRLRTLYLVEDDIGCLEHLALDKDGVAKLPADFEFQDTRLERQFAELPRVSKYGLPDYLANAREFFGRFGITLANTYEHDYRDLGDDSGDSCRIFVTMPEARWQEMLVAVQEGNAQFEADVAEWVGLHYGRILDQEPQAKQTEWVQRYLDSREPTDDTDSDPSPEPESPTAAVIFEYVYPDEDGDTVAASVDLHTGTVSFTQVLPADVHSPNVRTRIWVTEDGEPLESAGDGVDFETVFYRQWPAAGTWTVLNLPELQRHLAQFVKL
jgi:hypothetical protein